MLRFGRISEVDYSKGLARVHFEEDDIVSDWLKISIPNSSKNKDEAWYDVKEPVWCMMDEHCEHGVIGGSYYDSESLPTVGTANVRRTTFDDGSYVEFNRETSIITVHSEQKVIVTCKSAQIVAEDATLIECPTVTVSGDLIVQGSLTAEGGAEVQGSVNATGSVTAQGQVEALSGTPAVVRLSTHMHPTAVIGPPSPPTPGT